MPGSAEVGDDSTPPVRSTEKLTQRVVPFWVLQLGELLAAVAFADLSLYVERSGLLLAGTAILALLAVTAKGPLGLLRVVPRPLHVILAYVVAVVLALAPILPQVRPDIEGIIVVELGAVGLFRLASLTRTDVKVAVPQGPVAPPDPVVGPPLAGSSPTVTTPDVAARWLGRQAGTAAQAASKTVEQHGPTTKAQIRRTVRSAGWLAGRATRSGETPSPEE